MPAPSDHTAAFDAALRRGGLPPTLRGGARGFDVYRNNSAASLRKALAARYPVVERLVGQDFFAAMAGVFIDGDRPSSPVLQEWGGGFAAFLAGFPPVAALPYLPDVARIEWARGIACHAADAPAVDPAALADADPDTLVLTLHSSVQVLTLATPAVTVWTLNQPDAVPAPVPHRAETALILRDPMFNVPVIKITPADADFVTRTAAGATLTRAADGHPDPQPILTTLLRLGAFVQGHAPCRSPA